MMTHAGAEHLVAYVADVCHRIEGAAFLHYSENNPDWRKGQ
jgi:hypothetical protein